MIHACWEGLRLMALGMLPRVRYTGYADLLPENWVSWVLSVAMITGATTEPSGNCS
jgi:hypothetical protein